MSDEFGFTCLDTVQDQYLDQRLVLNCADSTAAKVDAAVIEILKQCYKKACEMIRENRDVLDKIAEYLYEHETITGKEFMKIFCELKNIPLPKPKNQDTSVSEIAEENKQTAEALGSLDNVTGN
jgi:cell division protease FtsH